MNNEKFKVRIVTGKREAIYFVLADGVELRAWLEHLKKNGRLVEFEILPASNLAETIEAFATLLGRDGVL